ncbi:MAG: ABC transporter permease subunit, partial [Candidatus Bipolaricaulota bacterium]
KALETLLMAPLAVSSVVLGLALLLAFRRPPLSALGGTWAIVLAHTLIVYPFVVRAIRPLWDGLDPTVTEAARTLGATRFAAFRTVELPLLAGGVLAAGAFAFALSLGEMTAVAMLSGPGVMTMPMAIYHFLGNRDFGAASAMATVLMVTTALAAWAWDRLGTRWLGKEDMSSVSRLYRGDAEFAEKSWSEDSNGLGFGFNSKTDFLRVLCVSAVNKYGKDHARA